MNLPAPKIMVVEDERIVALHIRQQLEKLGYAVPSVVASGELALERIASDRPDLILMDIRIEGPMDGIETASRIPEEFRIPVIYLTAYSEEATLARARSTHPHGYLLKPFSERELHATIQMAMERCNTEAERIKHLEASHQAQKLEAIGQLAGGVAHDFNNLLTIIQGNLELIQERNTQTDINRLLGDACKAAQRGAALTRQLLGYSRQSGLATEVLDLPLQVAEMCKLLQRLIGETIEIRTAMPESMWKIRADQTQLETALINLSVNSRDAMPDGGVLCFGGQNLEQVDARTCRVGKLAPGRHASLTVSDTGSGMPEAVLQQALDPFFTTKPAGKGTGLGLSQVASFVMQAGGAMDIRSNAQGTAVELIFPAVETDASAHSPPLPDPASVSVTENTRVLLVEDDELVRRSVALLLRSLGYQVVEAANGHDACSLLTSGASIDLMLTDLVLPGGMSGTTLAREALRLQPGIKLLFMSGYLGSDTEADTDLLTRVGVLQKPFTKAMLGERVAAATRAPGPQFQHS